MIEYQVISRKIENENGVFLLSLVVALSGKELIFRRYLKAIEQMRLIDTIGRESIIFELERLIMIGQLRNIRKPVIKIRYF